MQAAGVPGTGSELHHPAHRLSVYQPQKQQQQQQQQQQRCLSDKLYTCIFICSECTRKCICFSECAQTQTRRSSGERPRGCVRERHPWHDGPYKRKWRRILQSAQNTEKGQSSGSYVDCNALCCPGDAGPTGSTRGYSNLFFQPRVKYHVLGNLADSDVPCWRHKCRIRYKHEHKWSKT